MELVASWADVGFNLKARVNESQCDGSPECETGAPGLRHFVARQRVSKRAIRKSSLLRATCGVFLFVLADFGGTPLQWPPLRIPTPTLYLRERNIRSDEAYS